MARLERYLLNDLKPTARSILFLMEGMALRRKVQLDEHLVFAQLFCRTWHICVNFDENFWKNCKNTNHVKR